MKHAAVLLLLIVGLCGSVDAARPWAPGAKSPGKTSGGGPDLPPMVLRLGVTFTSTDIESSRPTLDSFDKSVKGLQLEAGVRAVTVPLSPKMIFMLDLPAVFSLLYGDTGWDENSIMLYGRGIPTARLGIPINNGMIVSPFIGYGAGTNLNIYRGLGDNFQLVWALRLGGDLMFNEKMGVGLAYTRNSSDFTYSWLDNDATLKLNELSFSFVMKL